MAGFAYITNLAELAVWAAASKAAKPRFQFVYNDPDGDASQSYRLRIYKGPSGGSTDFDSGVVPQVVAAGATITADPNYLMANADGPKAGVNRLQSGSSTDANNYVTGSVTLKAGRLYLLAVENSKGSASADAVSSITGGGGLPTFTSRSTTLYNSNLNRVSIWSAVPAADYTGTLTINFGGVTQTGACWSVDELTGVDTTTTDGVVQQAVGTGNSGTALATLAAFASTSNPTYGAQGHAAATASAPGSGFSELADQTQATPAQALSTVYRVDSDTTADATFTSAQWGMCAVELQSAERWWTVELVDAQGDTSGESSRLAVKVRYGQGLYEYNPGASSSAWAFAPGSTQGGTQATYLFRSATSSGGEGATGKSAWYTDIASVPIQAWVQVLVRLATYTVGTDPALPSMQFSYLGAATTPDRWTGTPTNEWALVTDTRRFGARAIKCTVVSGVTGNRYIVPFRKVAGDDIQVSKNTKYTFSAYVKTVAPLTGGNLRLAVSRAGSDTDFITPSVASPIVTDTSTFPDGWQRLTMTFTTESTEAVRPMVLYTRSSGVNEAFYTDAWKVEEGSVATAWTPGFIGQPIVLDANGIQVDGVAGGIARFRGSDGSIAATVELGAKGFTQGGVEGGLIPTGGIIMWSGETSAIPLGWALCDGTNGTPDLRDRFVIGADTTNENSSGGTVSASAALATHAGHSAHAALGNHAHSFSGPPTGWGAVASPGAGGAIGIVTSFPTAVSNGASGGTPDAHSAHDAHAVPKFYRLAFIMRL